MIRLRRLKSGDRVALVAPASSFPREEVEAGVAELSRLGLEAVYDESIFERSRFVAGSVETRVRAIHAAWEDPSIAALIAMRGGYGSAQLLPLLDPNLLRSARKALIGYSDITTLLAWYQRHGLTAIHGPMIDRRISKGPSAYDEDSFRRVVMQTGARRRFAAGATRRRCATALRPARWSAARLTQLMASLGHAVGIRAAGRLHPVPRGHRRAPVSRSIGC